MTRDRASRDRLPVRAIRFLVTLTVGLGATLPTLAASSTPQPEPVATPSGPPLWSDDFGSSTSGWSNRTMPSGATLTYGDHEYLITPGPKVDDLAQAPYAPLQPQLIVSVNVAFPSDAPKDLRGGVECGRPSALDSRYVFFVSAGGDWEILRVDENRHPPHGQVLLSGSLRHAAPGTPIPLVAVCSDQGSTSSATTTELSFFVNGGRVGHITDTWTGAPGAGWRAGLDAGPGAATPRAVLFTDFALSDASFGSAKPIAGPMDRFLSQMAFGVVLALCALGSVLLVAFVVGRRRRARLAAGQPSAAATPATWGEPPAQQVGPSWGPMSVPPPPPPLPPPPPSYPGENGPENL